MSDRTEERRPLKEGAQQQTGDAAAVEAGCVDHEANGCMVPHHVYTGPHRQARMSSAEEGEL